MTQRPSDELVLAIPPEPGAIAITRLFVAACCRHMGMDEDRIDDVKIAVSEAVTNAVKAHMSTDLRAPIRVVVRPDEHLLEVSDAGEGFEPSVVETATPPAGLYEGSLGLSLIQSLFPGVQIERNRDGGMTIRFALDLQPASRSAT